MFNFELKGRLSPVLCKTSRVALFCVCADVKSSERCSFVRSRCEVTIIGEARGTHFFACAGVIPPLPFLNLPPFLSPLPRLPRVTVAFPLGGEYRNWEGRDWVVGIIPHVCGPCQHRELPQGGLGVRRTESTLSWASRRFDVYSTFCVVFSSPDL